VLASARKYWRALQRWKSRGKSISSEKKRTRGVSQILQQCNSAAVRRTIFSQTVAALLTALMLLLALTPQQIFTAAVSAVKVKHQKVHQHLRGRKKQQQQDQSDSDNQPQGGNL